MTIPDFEEIMLPFLKLLSDKQSHSTYDIVDHISNQFNLTKEEKNKLMKDGRKTFIVNKVYWARTYLKNSGLIEYPLRGTSKITNRGSEILKQDIKKIDRKFLSQFKEYREFKTRTKKKEKTVSEKEVSEAFLQTPEDMMEEAYNEIRSSFAEELLNMVISSSPEFFERLVVELLVRMGYGGTTEDAGKAIGKSGDEGIDGIIKEDRLGLDAIYIQAKRWQHTVGNREIRDFIGALKLKNAKKGVLITTANFVKKAKESVKTLDTKIVLIDGEELANLMIEYNLGVSTTNVYEIKEVDSDYFPENI